MKLNKMQAVAVKECTKWFKRQSIDKKPWFEISGAAGTGKTTVVRCIVEELGLSPDEVMYMAFVGKATLALRLNGLNAQTIHSSIYELKKVPARDEAGKIIMKHGRPLMKNVFVLKSSLPPNIKCIVLDEGGMVNNIMGVDILSFKIPVIVLGDRNQLPPVFGQSLFLQAPDVTLNEIMRQEKDSPIIYLSQLAIHGIQIPYGSYGGGQCEVIRKHQMTDNYLQEADLVICGTNSTRDELNHYMRNDIFNIHEPTIQIGDKLICRQNNWDVGLQNDIVLVNGLIGYTEGIYRETTSPNIVNIDFRPEFIDDDSFKKLPIDHKYLFSDYYTRKNTNTMYSDGIIFEFGYCITCHLSQGSQYDTVLVYNESLSTGVYQRQWLYTALTRAKKRLILAI